MTRLYYTFSCYVSDVAGVIRDKLECVFPDMPLEDRVRLADQAVEDMKPMGNGALYEGLVLLGLSLAQRKAEAERVAATKE